MNEKQLEKGNKLSLLIHSAQDSLHGPLLHAHSGTCLSHWEKVNHGDCASDTLVRWHSTGSQTVSYSMIWPEEPARRPSLLSCFSSMWPLFCCWTANLPKSHRYYFYFIPPPPRWEKQVVPGTPEGNEAWLPTDWNYISLSFSSP